MLGADSISIELAGEDFELRPTLRACMRLVRRHQFPALLAAARDFNLTIVTDILRESGISPALLLKDIAAHGLNAVRSRLAEPLARFVLAVAGVDPNEEPKPATQSEKPLTPHEYHARLFEVATGWLGWAPEEAWSATAAEIIAAKAGRSTFITEILKAALGTTDAPSRKTEPTYTTERLKQIEEQGFDPAFDRDGLKALKGKGAA